LTPYQTIVARFGTPVKETSTELKCACPECGHNSLTVSLEYGMYYCFVCEYGTNEKPLFKTFNKIKQRKIDYSKHLEICKWLPENLTLSESHRRYMKSRGLINPDKFKIKTIPSRIENILLNNFDEEFLFDSGFLRQKIGGLGQTTWPCLKPNKILIPILNKFNVVGLISRADPRTEAQESLKYCIPYGSKANSTVYYNENLKSSDVIITEGQLKAIIPYETLGISTIGTFGINGATAALNFYFANKLKFKEKRIFVINDSEKDENAIVGDIQALKLVNSIGSNACFVSLPRNKPQTKMDIDTYVFENDVKTYDLLEDFWANRRNIFKEEIEKQNEKTRDKIFSNH
jgi:hypothetical protein